MLLAAPIQAQEGHNSHVPVPPAGDIDPAKLFQERVAQARLKSDFGDLLKKVNKPGAVSDVKQLQKLWDLIQSNPQLDALVQMNRLDTPESRHQIRELLGDMRASGQPLPTLNDAAIRQQLKSIRPMAYYSAIGTLRAAPGMPDPPVPPKPPPPPPVIDEAADHRRQLARQIADWAERFPREHLAAPVRNSPMVQDLFRKLSQSANDALRGDGTGEGLDAELARWEERWKAATGWLPPSVTDSLRNVRLPDPSRWLKADSRLPFIDDVEVPRRAVSRVDGSGVDTGAIVNLLLVVIGAAVLAAVLWRLRAAGLAGDAADRRPLGPWPLDPAAVASRDDLIRAFEYLSLLRCGEPARTWHHRAIADCLGGTEAERRAAAEQLAALYEQARYAPRRRGRPEPDWTAARGPLALLAGAG